MTDWKPMPHPLLPVPDAEKIYRVVGDAKRAEQVWMDKHAQRAQIMAEERADPLVSGWEPPIWRVVYALLGMPFVDASWAAAMRAYLKFEHAVKCVLISGGNRSGKSEFGAKTSMKILTSMAESRCWAFHTNAPMSVEYTQPLHYKYLPPHLREREIRSETTYVAYKQKTGFSDAKYVLPNRSEAYFRNYEQKIETIEGGEVNIVTADELLPPDWLQTLMFRTATRDGWIMVYFTPVQGYTPTVRVFQDGAEVVQECDAFLLPRDGGEPDEARALGLTQQEYAEQVDAKREKRPATCPASRPEDCDAWLRGEPSQPVVPAGRTFERVPRVMKCVDPEKAVVFFSPADNPYGNPMVVTTKVRSDTAVLVRERWYGIANKTISARFPKFGPIHIVDPEAIPKAGTNYLFVDPASGRNFFMSWFRFTPQGVYLYREWPGNYFIDEVGVPGPWATPDGKHLDGRAGPAQESFGFGLLRYKEEIAKLEGWRDARAPKPPDMSREDWVAAWDDEDTDEPVEERYMDSRFASSAKLENDRPTTLLEEFDEIGMNFIATPGDDINEGVKMLETLLYYRQDAEIGYFNMPKFFVASDCTNTIFSLQTWTGKDGRKGACKDPVDNCRYAVLSDCDYIEVLTPGKKPKIERAGRGVY
ncbi:MAG: hypothetical protein OES34_09740 [Nitrosopumilus sp.]|nr:hypothetical protein [Nitrosopumilus sp.]